MTPEISEFSYGFALTNEVVGWASLKAAPIFPSLIEEGKAGGGYDVKLDVPGIPLYLQFKRADCMTRRNAREISKEKLPLGIPFFRFPITQAGKSNQHALLLELDDGANAVFYAAPRFHRLTQINRAWSAKEVAARSIFVRPATIGRLDSDSHYIAYDETRAYLCSRPKPVDFASASNVSAALAERLASENRNLREALPLLNTSLIEAWARGSARVTTEESDLGESMGERLRAIAKPSNELSGIGERGVPSREPLPLSEASVQLLRELADNAINLFDAQLVIVQEA